MKCPSGHILTSGSGVDTLRLLPLPAQSVSGPVHLGGYALRFDGDLAGQAAAKAGENLENF